MKIQIRVCEMCGNDIPLLSKADKPLSKCNYECKITCLDPLCLEALKRKIKPFYRNLPRLEPIDYFLRGETSKYLEKDQQPLFKLL